MNHRLIWLKGTQKTHLNHGCIYPSISLRTMSARYQKLAHRYATSIVYKHMESERDEVRDAFEWKRDLEVICKFWNDYSMPHAANCKYMWLFVWKLNIIRQGSIFNENPWECEAIVERGMKRVNIFSWWWWQYRVWICNPVAQEELKYEAKGCKHAKHLKKGYDKDKSRWETELI